MSESEIINNIFSEALHSLESRWQDDTASAQVRGDSPPKNDTVGNQTGGLKKEETDSEEVEDRLTDTHLAVPDEKESMVALKRDDDDGIPDIPPEIAPAAEEDDLDSLLEDLAKSADPDGEGGDGFSGLLGEDEEGDFDADLSGQVSFGGQVMDSEEPESDSSGNSLDDLLEHALGLADTPENGGMPEFADDDEDDELLSGSSDGEGSEPQEEDADGDAPSDMMERSFEQDDEQVDTDSELDNLLGSSAGDGEEDDSSALSDDLFASDDVDEGFLPGQDLSELLDGDDEAEGDVVRTVKVPEPSIPVVEDADEELERKLAEMGLGDDNLLHNRFSAGKEKLLRHLLVRFEALARQKLEPLPTDQVNLVRSVNLRVEIDLKFGEFTTSGDDDSLFKLDV